MPRERNGAATSGLRHQDQVQIALDRVRFGQTHVFDLPGDGRPIGASHPLPLRKAAEQIGLMLRPGRDVAIVETIRKIYREVPCRTSTFAAGSAVLDPNHDRPD